MPEEEIRASHFGFPLDATIVITAFRAIRNPKIKEKKGEIVNPRLLIPGNGRSYTIPAGYQRVLLGLLREIDFEASEKIGDPRCTSRARYLVKVLDAFVLELRNPGDRQSLLSKRPSKFRSKVLNPILQRQRLGVLDNVPNDVRKAVGLTDDDAQRFYLSFDPLHPSEANGSVHNLLYLPSVRLSLCSISLRVDKAAWDGFHHNTQVLWRIRGAREAEGAWDHAILDDRELEVIRMEHYPHLYQNIIQRPVRTTVFWPSVSFLHLNRLSIPPPLASLRQKSHHPQ